MKIKSVNFIKSNDKINTTIDILKLIMALLVVGIHTEPFSFNIWFDRGFGIITRMCVPFFFITSAYLYWIKDKSLLQYLQRIALLYIIWSIIYLPFDLKTLSLMDIKEILYRYLWIGNDHALWYLYGSIIGFIITYILLKLLSPKAILIIATLFLIIGCIKSTWSPLFENIFSIKISDWLGSRNGLFYAFPYIALGMFLAKNPTYITKNRFRSLALSFITSLIFLGIESFIFVIFFHTKSTILWFSVLPCTFFLFLIALRINIHLNKEVCLFLRKISILIYVSHTFFIYLYSQYFDTFVLYILVSLSSIIFAILIIKLSTFKSLQWLKYLY